MISKFFLVFISISYMKTSTRNRPSEVLIDEEQSSFDNVISATTERNYNVMMKFDYPLRNCPYMLYSLNEFT